MFAGRFSGSSSFCGRVRRLTESADAFASGNLEVKMFSEFRRLALAVKEYRLPAADKLVTAAEELQEAEMRSPMVGKLIVAAEDSHDAEMEKAA